MSAATAPLAGVRVLDLTRMIPGNYCAWLLAALGADVIKVEDPGAGDVMRTIGVQVAGQSSTHHVVNRGKRSVVLDLKTDGGRERFLRLVDTAQVVVDSFRPGVMDRLGVGQATLRARRPGLVVASISGFGADGPLSRTVAHDLNAQAWSGFLERLVGPDDGLPQALTAPLADVVGGGLVPALGIVALLRRAEATGEGAWLDASLAEGFALMPSVQLADLLAGEPMPPRGVDEYDGRAFYRTYHLRDAMVAVGAVEPHFWRNLCEALGLDDLVDAQWDDARKDETVERFRRRFAELTAAEVTALVGDRDTCASLVNSYADMLAAEHTAVRGLVRPSVDAPMQVPAPPFVIDGERPPETVGAPTQGQHTDELLAALDGPPAADPVATVLGYFEALDSYDLDGAVAAFSEPCAYAHPDLGGPDDVAADRDQLRAFWSRRGGATGYRHVPTTVALHEGQVFVQGHILDPEGHRFCGFLGVAETDPETGLIRRYAAARTPTAAVR
jgi:crotonobetainyl-CoA:carnitine CoA-transferase CaiB-like acyl-CoA transferase